MSYSMIIVPEPDLSGKSAAKGETVRERAVSERALGERAVGEKVFLADLPISPKAFILFYPGHTDTEAVQKLLRDLGNRSGNNIFVNFGELDDPDYDLAATFFGFRSLPVIFISAIAPLAGVAEGKTAFVRLDGEALFEQPDKLMRSIEEIVNLFLRGEVAKAAKVAQTSQRKADLSAIVGRLLELVRPAIKWIADIDVLKVDVATGKIEIRRNGAG